MSSPEDAAMPPTLAEIERWGPEGFLRSTCMSPAVAQKIAPPTRLLVMSPVMLLKTREFPEKRQFWASLSKMVPAPSTSKAPPEEKRPERILLWTVDVNVLSLASTNTLPDAIATRSLLALKEVAFSVKLMEPIAFSKSGPKHG